MNSPAGSRKAVGKLSRTEVTSVRLEPKLRYMAELGARRQRRSISSFIEWAVENSLSRVLLKDDNHLQISVIDDADILWDVDPADRLVKLALKYPELLTHDEQILWKIIRENGYLWKGSYESKNGIWTWNLTEANFLYPRLREHWENFLQVAAGKKSSSVLPKWRDSENQSESPELVGANVLE